MSTSWLANADPATAWAHYPWSDFGTGAVGAPVIAVLPVHGFADHGLGLPLDAEEVVGSAVLRRAVAALSPVGLIRVLPPLRFTLAPYPSTFFGIDPETAHALIDEVARSVRDAGIHRLVFVNTSPWNSEFIEAASLDARAGCGLHTFVINLRGVGLDFHPGSTDRARTQAVAAQILSRPPEVSDRPADIRDAGFRPGQFRQAAPLVPDATIDGAAALTSASAQLAQLLAEVLARALPGSAPVPASAAVQPKSITVPTDETLWPASRARYLGALTRDELEALPDKDSALVILPTGAIEQHGHHLPVGVDAILGQARLHHALLLLPNDAPVYVAPPLTFGKSTEHEGFPGTVSIAGPTLRRLILAVATQLRALGFRRLAVLNTHGGNSAVIVYTLRELQDGAAFCAGLLSGFYTPAQDPLEAAYGFHAGEWETSLMLACSPSLVRMDRSVREYPPQALDSGSLRPGSAPAVYSWLTRDLSVSGVIGDATLGSTGKGIRWMTESSTALATQIERLRVGH
jgi:creatinine amidohydrolase